MEQKRLGIPASVPVGVQQWQGLIAVNYAARAAGISRHMRVQEAKQHCPDLKTVHVQTLGKDLRPPMICFQALRCFQYNAGLSERQTRGHSLSILMVIK